MADESTEADEDTPTKKKGGVVIGLVLALLGGGGAFAYTSGMLDASNASPKQEYTAYGAELAFVPLDPMTVSLGDASERRFLRFRAELEVAAAYENDVKKLLPRVVDVLHTYLQSLTLQDIEDPSSLLTLRSQMRRRVDLVVGGDRVHDLLVMEFVVN